MEILIHFILYLETVEFLCHSFNTSSYFVVVYLTRNLDSRYHGLFFPCTLI